MFQTALANISSATPAPRDFLTTEELAARLGLRPQSIRARLCRTGSYFGLRPVVLPNRRLLWRASELEVFLESVCSKY